jgi:hypothetical protein
MGRNLLLASLLLALAAANAVAGDDQPSCSKEAATPGERTLTKSELRRVVDFVVARIHSAKTAPQAQELGIEIHEQLGITVPASERARIKAAVVTRLRANPVDLAKISSGCDKYGACSLESDLTGASGDVWAMYKREKAQDGHKFSDFALPAAAVQDLSGRPTNLSALKGTRTLLVMLAGHCEHSIQTLDILQSLHHKYGPQGLHVVGLFVNSGSPEDMRTWIPRYKPEYAVWVVDDTAIGKQLRSNLTPTFFLVDERGMVHEKLVGLKTELEVSKRVDAAFGWKSKAAAGSGSTTVPGL